MKRRFWFGQDRRFLGFLGLLLVLGCSQSADQGSPLASQEASAPSPDPSIASPIPLGEQAPDFSVKSPDGTVVKLSKLRGQVVMLDFWATWCPPCLEGLPETARLAQESIGKGVRVLPISWEPPSSIKAFLKSRTLNLKVYFDSDESALRAYRVDPIPSVVIIDRTGKVKNYFIGLQSPATLASALNSAGANLPKS
jgi:peroxiredoxin